MSSVPNNEFFALSDVYAAVDNHSDPSADLSSCFANAISYYYDPAYNNSNYAEVGSILRFRNYRPFIDTYVVRYNGTIPAVVSSDGRIRQPAGYTDMRNEINYAAYDRTNKVLIYTNSLVNHTLVRDVSTGEMPGKQIEEGLTYPGYVRYSSGVWFIMDRVSAAAKYKFAGSYASIAGVDGNITSSTITGVVEDVRRVSTSNWWYTTYNQVGEIAVLGSSAVIRTSLQRNKPFVTGAGNTNPKILVYDNIDDGTKAAYTNTSSWSSWKVGSDTSAVSWVATYGVYSFVVGGGVLYVVNHDTVVSLVNAGTAISPGNWTVYSVDVDANGYLHVAIYNSTSQRYEICTNTAYTLEGWQLHSYYSDPINQLWVY